MPVVERTIVEDDDWHSPRTGLVEESPPTGTADAGPSGNVERIEFAQAAGPFREYRRTVVRNGDTATIHETTVFELSMPLLGWIFTRLYRRAFARGQRSAWWSAPVPIDRRAADVLGLLTGVALLAGYMGTVMTTTITFAADQFGADRAAQGWALAAVRFDVLLALPLAASADRLGRRRLLVLCATVGPVGMALSAVAPGLWWLAAMQVVTRGFVTAMAILIGVVLVEEMPAAARGYCASVLVSAAALGSGLAVALGALADLGPSMWRLLFAIPLLGLPITRLLARLLPESRRFDPAAARNRASAGDASAGDASAGDDGPAPPRRPARLREVIGRLALLAGGTALLAVFSNPARQFNNEFLRTERGFSAARLSLFGLLTAAPGSLGLLVGGKIADRRGRRVLVVCGLTGGIGCHVAALASHGAALWVWSIGAATMLALALPALSIYGPELFPTRLRGITGGVITAAGRIGGAAGLIAVGQLSDNDAPLGRAISVMAVAPLMMVLLVLFAYPETARRELEDLNPDDSQSATNAATSTSRLRRP